jgi:transcriptional regulator with XRE-family HTH domain
MGDPSVFTRRLKEARQRRGLSQEQLGVLAGIDEFSASARMNQYERGKHVPHPATVERIAKGLDVPVAYLFADDDGLAELLLVYAELGKIKRGQLLEFGLSLKASSGSSKSKKSGV